MTENTIPRRPTAQGAPSGPKAMAIILESKGGVGKSNLAMITAALYQKKREDVPLWVRFAKLPRQTTRHKVKG